MPSNKHPVGSVADLPEDAVILAAEEARETDIDELFGMGEEPAEPGVAATGGETTASGDAGAAGAGAVDGPQSAPAKEPKETPPAGDAVPGQTAAGTDGTSAPPSGQQAPEGAQTPAPGAAPAPVAPVDPNLLKVNSLEATVQALTAELAQLRASPAPGAQPQAGQGQQPPASGQQEELPRYALTLPPQVAAALTSGEDDKVVAGITHMMNSLATIVHHNVRLENRQALEQIMQFAKQQETETVQQQQVAASREDYYKAFPSHKDPLILPIIQAESMAMAGEFPGLPWNDNYRNALGQRVEARLTQLRGGVQQPTANGGTPPPSQPAASLPGGARQDPAPGGELTGGDLIVDTFS